MNKTTIPGVTISRVQRTHTWWRYFWPIQTWDELRSTLTVLAIGLPVVAVVKHLLAPTGMLSVLIGGAIGGILSIGYCALPARLTLTTRSEARHHLKDLQAMLLAQGYVTTDQPVLPGSYLYRSKLPRWLICDAHDNLKLVVRDHQIVLTGPIASLYLLRARLLPDPNAYLKA